VKGDSDCGGEVGDQESGEKSTGGREKKHEEEERQDGASAMVEGKEARAPRTFAMPPPIRSVKCDTSESAEGETCAHTRCHNYLLYSNLPYNIPEPCTQKPKSSKLHLMPRTT
jgi:hypothetical protein